MAGIQVQLNEEATRQEDYALSEKDLFDQQGEVNRKLSDEASAVAEAARIDVTEKGQLELNNTIKVRAAADVLGGNIQNHAAEKISGLASEQEETRGQMKVALGEYRKNVDASFFDNPVRWIHANVFGGTEQSAQSYNAVATQYNESKARLSTVLDQTKQEVANERSMEFTTTDKMIAAQARIKAFQYMEAAARADYNKLGSDIGGLEALSKGGASALNMRVKAYDEIRSDAAESRANAEFSMRKQQFAEYMKQANEKDESDKLVNSIAKAGYAGFKLAVPDDANIRGLRTLSTLTPEGKFRWEAIMSAGQYKLFAGKDPESTPVSLGQDPYTAIKAINLINSRLDQDPTVAEYKPRIQYLRDTLAVMSKTPGLDEKKNPVAFREAFNEKVLADSKLWAQNAGGKKDISDSPGFGAILKFNPTLAKSAFVEKVIAPMQTSGHSNIDEEQLLRITSQAMAEKKLTPEEASAGVTEYFNTALALNNKANFAFAMPIQSEYKAHVGFGSTKSLTRSADVTGLLLQLQSRMNPKELGSYLDQALRGAASPDRELP